MSDAQSNQIRVFYHFHPPRNVFTNTVDDSFQCSLLNLKKLPQFDDPPFVDLTKPPQFKCPPSEGSRTYQEVEALQLLPIFMSGSHDLDDIPEISQISISSHDSPLSTISPDESSLLKYFEIHNSLYSNLFVEESTPIIVSIPFYSCLASVDCD